ncbi:hypothetical protein BRAS3843_1830016 [Bradyrhizobium sp. STM 3843]|nr:hypothetical protein BRAS3843_1830016 [Bradyrhizobium sp. STM 3843]
MCGEGCVGWFVSSDVAGAVASIQALKSTGAHMGELIRFVPKSERDRERLIREARAIYDSIFPPANPTGEKQRDAPESPPSAVLGPPQL